MIRHRTARDIENRPKDRLLFYLHIRMMQNEIPLLLFEALETVSIRVVAEILSPLIFYLIWPSGYILFAFLFFAFPSFYSLPSSFRRQPKKSYSHMRSSKFFFFFLMGATYALMVFKIESRVYTFA